MFSVKISDRECTVFDKPFVEKAHQDLFEELKKDIISVHCAFKQPSDVIKQLRDDINLISQKINNNDCFIQSKFILALTSLYEAALFEKVAPTIKESKLLGLFSGNSLLLPKYEGLLNQYKEFAPDKYLDELNFKFIRPLGSKLRENYYKYVQPLQVTGNIYGCN